MRLFLCEKPSQAGDIARVLGATQRGEGCLRGNGVSVTWCIGHLLETAAPGDYCEAWKRWSLQQLPMLPAQWRLVVKPSTRGQLAVVKKLLAQASELVIATDADREGEMIAREVLDYCSFRGSIKRLWLSALNEASIRKALSQLRPESETRPLYFSALGRTRADWLMGMNLSRLFTLLGQQAGHDGVLSIGRVQTPTLKLVVDRERLIKNFVPVPYWEVRVQLAAHETTFWAGWLAPEEACDEAGRCLSRAIAEQVAQAIQAVGMAQVQSAQTKRMQEPPPLLFELAELQKTCSARLGLGAQQTLDVAQALYEKHKATSYPRVDCGYLPQSMHSEAPSVLAALVKTDASLASLVQQVNPAQCSRAFNDSKITAHHGIIPTEEPANLSAMSETERAVYDLIRRRYLMQFLPDFQYDQTTVLLESAGHQLKASGRKIIHPGWKIALPKAGSKNPLSATHEGNVNHSSNGQGQPSDTKDPQKDQPLPELTQGMSCQVQNTVLKDCQTKPPALYTEGTLIDAMKNIARLVTDPRLKAKLKETTGIGTNATRAAIIKGLLDKGLLLKNKQALTASEAAHSLIDAVPQAVSDPGTTALWEQALEMIEAGTLTLDDFVQKQANWLSKLIEKSKGTTLALPVESGPLCPLCGAATRKRSSKNGAFWGCSQYPDCKGIVAIEGKHTKTAKSHSPGKTRKTSSGTRRKKAAG